MSVLLVALLFSAFTASLVLLALAFSAPRGPFVWLLRRFGTKARPSLVRISRVLYSTAVFVAALGVVALIWPAFAQRASFATMVAITLVSSFALALPVRTVRGRT
jgi:hypothetical protein